MQDYNLIAVFNPSADKWLMCVRKKEPFCGLSNLVGGKIKAGENPLDAAYRELCEETGITRTDIRLSHLMDLTYHVCGFSIEIYTGRLRHEVAVTGEENDLYWSSLDLDYFDNTRYAGEGNLGHILRHILLYRKELLA
ncbi:MAG: NUDIX domain-containing protein [Clostridia bacterium]|nr:NUDIX domain-containing protein [Clostridia bacterium]